MNYECDYWNVYGHDAHMHNRLDDKYIQSGLLGNESHERKTKEDEWQMNKDINKTLGMLVPILRENGEKIRTIEAVHDWYKAKDYNDVEREYMKEVAEITFDDGYRIYADIGCDSNITAIYDVVAVIQQIKPRSKYIERIERDVYERFEEGSGMMRESMLYEDYIRNQVKEKSVYGIAILPTHILCDMADWMEKIRAENVQMRKIIERQNLPYDALGDYSHDSTEFSTADEWYRENFGAERIK